MKIGIMSDSATGFTIEEMKKYPELTIVPLIITDQQNTVYEDNNVAITSQQLYQKMIIENNHLKTSQTNRAQLAEYWDNALNTNDEILFLPIAKDASGQFENAQVLQKETRFHKKVHVFETGAAMVPLKFMVLIALKLAQANKTISEIINALNQFRQTYQCFISPNNLTYLARGGRAPSSVAKVANFLKLKPILKCKEKITKVTIKRTLNHAIKEMLTLITKTKDIINETLYIINAWCDQEIIDRAIKTAKSFGFTKFKIESMCNILQVHTGNNTIGFAVVPNEWVKGV